MTVDKAVSLLSQMFLIQFSKEEHEALAMAIDALNANRKDKPKLCRECEEYAGDGMYCASNFLVYDFSTSRENCVTEREGK